MTHRHQGRAREGALTTLTTVGEAGRALLRETVGKMITWGRQRASDGGAHEEIKAHLALP